MEIERKFLIDIVPDHLDQYPSALIEQAYICTDPVIRIRREDDKYYLTCKGDGMLAREECNLPMSRETFLHLITKAEGSIISKRRYLIPLPDGLKIELDEFYGDRAGLLLAEVEFHDLAAAESFVPPEWFGQEVTYDYHYHNSWMSMHKNNDA